MNGRDRRKIILAAMGGSVEINKSSPTITPAMGASLWDAPASVFTSGTYAWVAYGTNTLENDANTLLITYNNNAGGAYNYFSDGYDMTANITPGTWYKFSFDASVGSGHSVKFNLSSYSESLENGPVITETSPTNKIITYRGSNPNNDLVRMSGMGAGEYIRLDNIYLEPITFSSSIALIGSRATMNGVYKCHPIVTDFSQAGIVIHYKDANNYVLCYVDRHVNRAKLLSCITGTQTIVESAAITYISGAELALYVSGTDYYYTYNGVQVGIAKTIDNSGMGKEIYAFSTLAGNDPGLIQTRPFNGPSQLGRVLITFDDSLATTYTEAFAYMQTAGIVGTHYTWTARVGTGAYITWAQLQEMDTAGWSIANHGRSSTVLTALSQADAEAEFANGAADLIANSLPSAVKHYAYPGGVKGATTDAAMTAQGMLTGRMAAGAENDYSTAVHYTLGARSVGAGVSLATVITYMHNAIATGTACILVFHGIVAAGPTADETTITIFQGIVDYIVANSIPAITIEDLYALL